MKLSKTRVGAVLVFPEIIEVPTKVLESIITGGRMSKILLVEDNELNRDMLSRRLNHRGYEVRCAADGAEAISMARDMMPDLILMDLRLPDISGWEVTSILKSDVGTRDIPIIALSAHAMDSHRQKAIMAGCDDYDTKPIELEHLLSKMRKLLHRATFKTGHRGLAA